MIHCKLCKQACNSAYSLYKHVWANHYEDFLERYRGRKGLARLEER